MPPLATGRTPETSEVRATAEDDSWPTELKWAMPLPKLENCTVPVVVNWEPGVVVPMPTLPLAKTVKSAALDEEATVKTGRVGELEVPSTTKVEFGVAEPMPMLPDPVTVNLTRLLVPNVRGALRTFKMLVELAPPYEVYAEPPLKNPPAIWVESFPNRNTAGDAGLVLTMLSTIPTLSLPAN